MTWSHGYFCPKCECRWVKHLCRDLLPCGCGIRIEDAVYIYTKRYARAGMEIHIAFKGYVLEDFIPREESYEDAVKRLYRKVEEDLRRHPGLDASTLKKAIDNALFGRSLNLGDWPERCGKCEHFNSVYDRKKCEIHDWCSVGCKDFLKREDGSLDSVP
ncbi:hypothetical protein Ferp_0582 [Ferroglobus placidus DSM 10642]|uniref:Uncharacterized protein n=1 Tax=Ferroglobus placidus (strain DSM 10642 / AEDII12DO) TaxID=589924 RepID=D3S3C2_FERPA|nr:hypothetical protein [Ferroglobus placidus]ADC64755.1 hypothetical protein Ferp_0582 [Ferroglobus placidus DSM 10642]